MKNLGRRLFICLGDVAFINSRRNKRCRRIEQLHSGTSSIHAREYFERHVLYMTSFNLILYEQLRGNIPKARSKQGLFHRQGLALIGHPFFK